MLSSCIMSFHCTNKLQFIFPHAVDKLSDCFWYLLTIIIRSAQAILYMPLLYICIGYMWGLCAPTPRAPWFYSFLGALRAEGVVGHFS